MAEVRQNILYITQQGLYLHHELEVLKVEQKDKTLLSLPLQHLQGVVIFGVCSISPSLMQKCLQRNIHITFASERGRFMGMVQGSYSGNILLREAQFKLRQNAGDCLAIAKIFIAAKLQNQRQLLLRRARESDNTNEEAELRETSSWLEESIRQVALVKNAEALRGVEGEAAKRYFSNLNYCLTQNKEEFAFDKRTRRPPRSRINALLSFAYALLTNDCVSACQATGLDPFCGIFHSLRPGRPALALDLVEEFRSYADRFVLSLINRKQIQGDDIEIKTGGVCSLQGDAKKRFIKAWQERKQEEVTHEYLNQKCYVFELPYLQARILAKTIRGELKTYVPFLWR